MSKKINDGGSAFPVPGFEYLDDSDPEVNNRVVHTPFGGMTLRDYFAAKAMKSLMDEWVKDIDQFSSPLELAETAYEYADAMLAARSMVASDWGAKS